MFTNDCFCNFEHLWYIVAIAWRCLRTLICMGCCSQTKLFLHVIILVLRRRVFNWTNNECYKSHEKENVIKTLSYDENDMEKDFNKSSITLNPTSSITKVVLETKIMIHPHKLHMSITIYNNHHTFTK